MTLDFLSSIFPGWAVMSLDGMIFPFHSLLDLLDGVLAFWICSLKIFKSLQNYWHRIIDITRIKETKNWTFWTFFRSYSELLSKIGELSSQEYVSEGISHPVFYGDLVYKLKRAKGVENFVSSGSKIASTTFDVKSWPSNFREDNRFCGWPWYIPFLKRCVLTNKMVGTVWRPCPTLLRWDSRQDPDSRPLSLLVGTS